MDIYEQIEKLDRLIEFVEIDLPKYAEQVAAVDLAALVADRVIMRGEDFRGNKFKAYSVKPVAAWRFWGKSRNQSAEKKIRALASTKGKNIRNAAGKKIGGSISYKEFRELNNLETDNKNFEFTGEMWKKFGVLRMNVRGKDFRVVIAGKTPAAQEKIDENSQREGLSIIEASEKEITLVQRTSLAWFEDQAKRILEA